MAPRVNHRETAFTIPTGNQENKVENSRFIQTDTQFISHER